MTRAPSRQCLACAVALAAAVAAPDAAAQYFGGNKVRYEDREFRVLSTEHVDVYTYAEEDAGARIAAVMMERWNARLEQVLEHKLTGRQPLILYAGHPHFRQTNATPGEIGEGTGGFTEMFKRRIVLPFAGPASATDHVLGHELVHAFQFDVGLSERTKQRGRGRVTGLPLWFIEGMAEYLSLGSADPHTAMWMRDAVLHDDLPTIAGLNNPRYFPYRYGHAFWAYVAGRFGDDSVTRLLRAGARTGNASGVFRTELEVDHRQLSKDWHEALKQEFGPAVAAARPASDYGRVLVAAQEGRAQLNIAPSLSPDGRRLLFFSERGIFSIELYLLDVESGEVLRSLTRTVTDPHLDSLQFLSSAGGWSPDGRRVAIGSVARGRPLITILDADSGDTVAEHRFDDLVEVLHPAWSPDGERIVFTGNAGGFLQLYLFEPATGARRQLTREPFTAMQPAWSPDGRRLAFATDRFTSDPRQLVPGDFRLALLEIDGGTVTAMPGLGAGKHINPQWSPDGRWIYFLGDAGGTSNLYRIDPVRRAIEQVTDLQTGIGGLTRLSPALSVAAQAPERIAVSVYEKRMHHIYLLGAPATTAPVTARDPKGPPPGALPPRERKAPMVDGLLAESEPGPSQIATTGPAEYHPRLGVDYVAQPNVGVGVSSVGSFVSGGIALFWSDMLGNHNLMTLLQAEGETETLDRNVAAVVSYENRRHRWRWGGAAGQVPSRSAFYASDLGCLFGQPTQTEQLVRQWQINREVAGRTAYPFTRAERFELSAGYRQISFIADAIQQEFDCATGQFISQSVVDLPAPESLDLLPAGVALVHDNSVFGGTAPAVGSRYRIELGGVVGDLAYYAPLFDYRHYLLPLRYLTLGGRALYYGRHGVDAENPLLGPIFLGSPTLVRGYSFYSFTVDECDPSAAPACPVLDQLFGTRIAMAGVEARVPVFGARALVHTPQAPPVDFAVFYDTGIAWTRDLQPGSERDRVSSYGVGMRVNLFGVAVLQWNIVTPVDRPDKGRHVEFLIAPGF